MSGMIGSFKPNFYRKVVNQSLRRSSGFLILFIIVISLVISFKNTLDIKEVLPDVEVWVKQNLEELIINLPTIEIEEGALTLPEDPYVKEWGDRFAFVVEPKQVDAYALLETHPNAVVLTHKKLITKTSKSYGEQSKIEIYDLKNVKFFKINSIESGLRITTEHKEFNITRLTIRGFFEKLNLFLYPLMFLLFFSIYIFTMPLQILIFSPISLIINTRLKAALSYKQLLNIGIYALVPCVSLSIVGDLLGLRISLSWVIYVLIYMVYLFLGIKSTHKEL